MKRTWTIIGVNDVRASIKWYQSLRPAGDGTGARRFWSTPRLGRNGFALPPRLGRPRAPLLDES